LRCLKCGIEVAGSWAWIWYRPQVSETAAVKKRAPNLWLCPDCAGEFKSDRARDAFLRRAGGEQ
jgi:hypothetical protein